VRTPQEWKRRLGFALICSLAGSLLTDQLEPVELVTDRNREILGAIMSGFMQLFAAIHWNALLNWKESRNSIHRASSQNSQLTSSPAHRAHSLRSLTSTAHLQLFNVLKPSTHLYSLSSPRLPRCWDIPARPYPKCPGVEDGEVHNHDDTQDNRRSQGALHP